MGALKLERLGDPEHLLLHRLVVLVAGGVGDLGQLESFAALHAGPAGPAVQVLASVAGPGVRERHAEKAAEGDDVGLVIDMNGAMTWKSSARNPSPATFAICP